MGLAKAIDTGAGIMAKGIMTRAAEEREEKRIAKREAAAEAKRLAAAQAKKEAAARKNQRIANSIATRFGVEPQNTGAMAHIMNEVEIHGTEAISVIQRDVDDKKFTLPDVEVTEEFVTGASPNQAPPIRLIQTVVFVLPWTLVKHLMIWKQLIALLLLQHGVQPKGVSAHNS